MPSGLAQLAHAASVAASAWLRTSRQRSAGSLSYEAEDGASGAASDRHAPSCPSYHPAGQSPCSPPPGRPLRQSQPRIRGTAVSMRAPRVADGLAPLRPLFGRLPHLLGSHLGSGPARPGLPLQVGRRRWGLLVTPIGSRAICRALDRRAVVCIEPPLRVLRNLNHPRAHEPTSPEPRAKGDPEQVGVAECPTALNGPLPSTAAGATTGHLSSNKEH